jgi:hypothetical protein
LGSAEEIVVFIPHSILRAGAQVFHTGLPGACERGMARPERVKKEASSTLM